MAPPFEDRVPVARTPLLPEDAWASDSPVACTGNPDVFWGKPGRKFGSFFGLQEIWDVNGICVLMFLL